MPEEDYKVKDGDCISSIAFSHGFFWETLWNHGKNSDLKSKRKDPNILKEGDVVHIPELSPKEESCATEKRHKFKLKGVPAKLKLKLMQPKKPKDDEDEAGGKPAGGSSPLGGMGGAVPGLPGGGSGGDSGESDLADAEYKPAKEEEEPIANAPYIFEVDGVRVDEGNTDGNGCIQIPLAPDAKEGRIIVNKGKPEERVITLDLGAMDPVDEPSGVRKRLLNLGYLCQPDGPADSEDLQAALRKFQQDKGLNVTGRIDDPTKNKLKELHGS